MKKTGCITLILVSLFLLQSPNYAASDAEFCEASREKPCLVKDSNKQKPVSSLRDTRLIADAYHGNTQGANDLRASASSAPSQQGWREVANYILAHTGYQPNQVLVLDLREENHGYLNGKAITLCDKHNWLNVGMTLDEINRQEQTWLDDLAAQEQVSNILTPMQFRAHEFGSGISIAVESLMNEAQMLQQLQFNYLRLPVSDHRPPLDPIVEQFVTLIETLPDTTWLHIHCRGGKGRTTTFLAMYDMLKNADKVSFDEIILRQASIPPYYSLYWIDREDPELNVWYQQRLQFLYTFYLYAQKRLSGYEGTWSEFYHK